MSRYLAILIVILITSGMAAADPEKAKLAYDKAIVAYHLQRWDDALAMFQRAYEEKQDPAFLYNIGQCQRQLGRYEAAIKSYRTYLVQSPDSELRAQVTARIQDMENALRDERSNRPPIGTQSPANELAAHPNTPSPVEAAPINPDASASSTARTLRLSGFALGGTGIALLGAGAACAGLSTSANNDAFRTGTFDPSAYDRFKTLQATSIALFAVGGAATVTGTVLYLLSRRSESHHFAAASSARQ